jgi:hypothetical protein
MSSQQRRQLVARLKEEGVQAYWAGTKRCHNPHSFMNAGHWSEGWDAAQEQDTDIQEAKAEVEADIEMRELAAVITRQISGADYYSGGEIELARQHITALQETVGVLAALLYRHTPVSVEELNDMLPSYGSPTITDDAGDLA